MAVDCLANDEDRGTIARSHSDVLASISFPGCFAGSVSAQTTPVLSLVLAIAASQLVDAIRAAHAGGSPISPEIAREIVHLFQKTGPPPPQLYL